MWGIVGRGIAGWKPVPQSGGGAHLFEEVDDLVDGGFGHVGELLDVEVVHGGVEVGEEFEAGFGDAGEDDAAVFGVAFSGDEVAGFEAVKEAGDIGVAGDHMFGDDFAGDAVGGGAGVLAHAAEDAEDVVLCGGEVVGFEEDFEGAAEVVGGAYDVEVGLLLDAIKGACFVDFLL